MPSFRQISEQFPALVIDAASSVVQVGKLDADGNGQWQASSEEAGVGIFQCLQQLAVDPMQAKAFVFCEGPGSVLGVRTVAMALRTWTVLKRRPIYAYSSLALVAHVLGRKDTTVIADARRDSWHGYTLGQGLRRIPTVDLQGDLAMSDNFRHWSNLPANVSRVPYSLADALPRVWEADLLTETDAPDAFLHEDPSYVTWTPQIHRAPAS